MNELLFESVIEKEALENLLALNQIKKCDDEINRYTEEIKELNSEMTSILRNENISEDYVEKIHKYKRVLSSLEGENGRIMELDSKIEENENRIKEFQAKAGEIEERLEILKKEIFETSNPEKVIDCQNEIETNNVRLNDINEIITKLVSDNTPLLIEKEYLAAKNSGVDFNIPNFNKKEIQTDLDRITKVFNDQIEKLDLPIRENIEFCQKKIKNRELEIEKFNARKNQVIESFPNSIQLDVDNAYEELANLLNELELTHGAYVYNEPNNFFEEEETTEVEEEAPMFEEETEEEIVEVKREKPDTEDIKEELAFFAEEDEEVVLEDPKEETVEVKEEPIVEESIIEEEPKEEKVEEKTETEEIGSVSYVLSDGESLSNIAEKVYPSKDNWQAIYYFNKDAIDQYLVSNGISNDFDTIKELANDTSVFTGIKLEIPTDYNYKI